MHWAARANVWSKTLQPALSILLVEDEELIALTLVDALHDAGFAVDHVTVGEDALKALEARGLNLSGVITDIRLGDAVNGWEIARKAREVLPQLPIVYMSGDSAHEHSAQGVPESIMVQKPFAPVQIITAISTLLNAVPTSPPA